MSTVIKEPEESGKTPGSHARRYPRILSEAGGRVGDRRVIGLAAVSTISEAMQQLEASALEDLGGESEVSALRHEILRLGVAAEEIGALLLNEIADKARHSRRHGHVPHVSRYDATAVAGYWIGLAARLYERVGLQRKPKHLSLDAYLRQKSESAAAGAAGAASHPDGVSPSTSPALAAQAPGGPVEGGS